MRRHLLGLTAVLFIAAAVGLIFLGGGGGGLDQALAGPASRIGVVLGAIWLAMPQLQQLLTRFPPWLLGMLLLGSLVIAARPRMAASVLPIAAVVIVLQFVGWIFRPPPKSR